MAKTVEEIRAEVEAAKRVAAARFTEATGCSTARGFVNGYLRHTIPNSTTPAEAMRKAVEQARS